MCQLLATRRAKITNVCIHTSGVKNFHHHAVGALEVSCETMDLRTESDLNLTIYAAEPGSPTADALQMPASWAAEPISGGVPISGGGIQAVTP